MSHHWPLWPLPPLSDTLPLHVTFTLPSATRSSCYFSYIPHTPSSVPLCSHGSDLPQTLISCHILNEPHPHGGHISQHLPSSILHSCPVSFPYSTFLFAKHLSLSESTYILLLNLFFVVCLPQPEYKHHDVRNHSVTATARVPKLAAC